MTTNDEAFEAFLREAARTPEVPPQSVRVRLGARLAGRFEVREKLGQGGMGQVFSAYDHEQQSHVALKLLGQIRPASIGQMKREFRAAAGLFHPNLVRLHELFSDGDEWFFTMELVDGVDLWELLAGSAGRNEAVLQDVLAQLACGLDALHQAGTLHRDLKPSNFLITRDEGRVVLLDFGLALPSGSRRRSDACGTPPYMAPEQKRARPLCEATDWFAFGVVLHEALTGQLPGSNVRARRLLRTHPHLGRLCIDLLHEQPEHRPNGSEVLRRLSARRSRLTPPPSAPTRSLVGRDQELHALHAAYNRCLRGHSTLALVQGPSGIGKTCLVEHFLRELREGHDALVLSGRCRERETLAYKAVDGLIDGVVRVLERLHPTEAVQMLPRGAASLAQLFPVLRATPAFAQVAAHEYEMPSADQARVRRRAIEAFGSLIAAMRRSGPTILWLDDMQWSDTDSALLLAPLLSSSFPQPILLIGSYREGGGAAGGCPLLEALAADDDASLPETVRVVLDVLAPHEAELMAQALLPDEDSRAATIARDGGGHPLLIAELAHVLTHSGEEWAGAGTPSGSLVEVIRAKVDHLPPRARKLLELMAIAGEPLPRQVLRLAEVLSPAEIEENIDVLRAHHLVYTHGLKGVDGVDVYHDRIREIVVASMTEARRKQHHLGLARTLTASGQGAPARRAAHYEAGGEPEVAGRYWIAAADQAMEALAFSHAATLYKRGLALAALEPGVAHEVELRRAHALALSGQGPAAADVYLAQVARVARDEGLELRRRAAEQLLLSGHLDRGLLEIERVVQATGMRATRGGRAALVPLVVGRLRTRFTAREPTVRDARELSREELAKLDAAWTTAWSLGWVDPIRGAEFQTRYFRMALKAGERRHLIRASVLEAAYAAASGPRSASRTARLLQRAERLATESRDAAAESLLCVARGNVAYLQGDSQDALRHCHAAIELLDRQVRGPGAVWERMSAQRVRIAALFHLGRYEELSELVPPFLAEFEGAGNLCVTGGFRTGYSTVAWLARHAVDEADRQLELATRESESTNFQLLHSNLLAGHSFRDLYMGYGVRAHDRILQRWSSFNRSQYLRIAVLRIQSWHLRGAAAVAAAEQLRGQGQPVAAAARQRDAGRAVATLQRQPMARSRAMASLIRAALAHVRGDETQAHDQLRLAVDRFEADQMQIYAAVARVRLGRLIGGERGRELHARAQDLMSAQRIADPAQIVSMLAPGFG